ncbi:hypothetical protein M885DRAFT_274421 [Pelagophyceae sp. CCMP2097]|nr:hypothetical protein M885DRAFT_274421 [Pelagophyceae sp. CCMP2097]
MGAVALYLDLTSDLFRPRHPLRPIRRRPVAPPQGERRRREVARSFGCGSAPRRWRNYRTRPFGSRALAGARRRRRLPERRPRRGSGGVASVGSACHRAGHRAHRHGSFSDKGQASAIGHLRLPKPIERRLRLSLVNAAVAAIGYALQEFVAARTLRQWTAKKFTERVKRADSARRLVRALVSVAANEAAAQAVDRNAAERQAAVERAAERQAAVDRATAAVQISSSISKLHRLAAARLPPKPLHKPAQKHARPQSARLPPAAPWGDKAEAPPPARPAAAARPAKHFLDLSAQSSGRGPLLPLLPGARPPPQPYARPPLAHLMPAPATPAPVAAFVAKTPGRDTFEAFQSAAESLRVPLSLGSNFGYARASVGGCRKRGIVMPKGSLERHQEGRA